MRWNILQTMALQNSKIGLFLILKFPNHFQITAIYWRYQTQWPHVNSRFYNKLQDGLVAIHQILDLS